MTLSKFRINVLARIIFIGILIGLLVTAVYKTAWIVTPFILLLLLGVAVSELVYYVEKTNREFADFLLSIKSSDFSRYNGMDQRGRSFSMFKEAFNTIIKEFHAVRIENEVQYTFLQTVVQNLSTAIISFDASGQVKLINQAAKDLLRIPFLNNIHTLQKINAELYAHITNSSNEILETEIGGQYLKLLIRAADFTLYETAHKLILVQNIKTEIDRTEIDAWEQLLHVLTHEIMNSITPISSLSGTIRKSMSELVKEPGGEHVLDDMLYGLQVIENRSDGLINFVNQYKSLITLPQPDLEPVCIRSLLERVRVLTQKQLDEKGVGLVITIADGVMDQLLDVHLVEQVLLNLVNNAVDALADTPHPVVELAAERQNDRLVIKVSDNGEGIDKELLTKIFIPFFTTKKNGTGVGLSLSRQIMQLHNGSIHVHSSKGGGTVFTLTFS